MGNSFIERAIDLALANVRQGRGGPFGAVIVRQGNIIAEGVNQVVALNDPTAHAEVMAIREACRRLGRFHLTECDLFTSCEPCPMCLGAVYWARVRRLYYAATRQDAERAGFSDAMIYAQLDLDPAVRSIPAERLDTPRAVAPFDLWLRTDGRIEY